MPESIPQSRRRILNSVLRRTSMHRVLIALSALALCGFATAQVTVISGYASNWAPGVYQAPGAYAAPFVPLVTTPSVSIETGLRTEIGASNATSGNVAGAANATISIVAPNMSASTEVQAPEPRSQSEASVQSASRSANRLELGVASFEGSRGAAQLMARSQQPSARTVTNDDIARLNHENGMVR